MQRFLLLCEGREVEFATNTCLQVVGAFDGIETGEQELHFLGASISRIAREKRVWMFVSHLAFDFDIVLIGQGAVLHDLSGLFE